MYVNVTELIKDFTPTSYSNSIANSGLKDIGRLTWNNALERAETTKPLQNPDQLSEFRKYCAEFGAWEYEEIGAWTEVECNALLIQMIAADMNEGNTDRLQDGEYYIGL